MNVCLCMFICIFIFCGPNMIENMMPISVAKIWPHKPQLRSSHLLDFSVVQVAGVILVSPFTSIRE